MGGYWHRADDTARTLRKGWLHTGDAGFLDENGYLYIHDRLKDMIVSGGENVYPAEIESALYGHADIADVAVIGVPDDRWRGRQGPHRIETGSPGGRGGHTAFRARKTGGVQDPE